MTSTGYLVHPQGTEAGAVLALHAWWGLNSCFRAICDRLAGEGLVVLAPDISDGEVAVTPEEAKAMRGRRRREPVYKGLLRSLDRLVAESAPDSPTGIVGFSMGGHWALWLAAREDVQACATVSYYAARACNFSQSRSAFQCHFAAEDPFVSSAARKRLVAAVADSGRPIETHDYPHTRHWFAESDRPEFEAAAAELAWERTIRFMHENMGRARKEQRE